MAYGLRLAAIVSIAILYAAVFYQDNPIAEIQEKKGHKTEKDSPPLVRGPASFERPLPAYHEGFINSKKSNTICHVSSVVAMSRGGVASAWYTGPKENHPDVSIFFSVYKDTDRTWSEPKRIVDRETTSRELRRYVRKVGNPMLFNDGAGRLWLFYSSVFWGGWSGSTINYKVSTDDGQSWSKARKMTLSPFFNLSNNIKNDGIAFSESTFVIPAYHELIRKFSQLIWVSYHADQTRYEIHRMANERNIIQPAILLDGTEDLVAFFRNSDHAPKRFIRTAVSPDLGATWSSVTNTPLPNPNSGFDVTMMTNGGYLAVINYTFRDRNNLSLLSSHDHGKTWKVLRALENGADSSLEYSYPSLTFSDQGSDGRSYFLTYTYERRKIKYLVFNEAWVTSLEESGVL